MSGTVESSKKSTLLFVIIILVVVLLIVLFPLRKRFSMTNNTVNMGETLNIEEKNLQYDFSIKVNYVKDISIKNYFSETETYKVVNITMTNRGKIPNALLVSYGLLDSGKKEVAISSSLNTPSSDDIKKSDNFDENNLKSSDSTTGNLYFDTTSNDVKQLEIVVATKGIESTDSDIKRYYVNIE